MLPVAYYCCERQENWAVPTSLEILPFWANSATTQFLIANTREETHRALPFFLSLVHSSIDLKCWRLNHSFRLQFQASLPIPANGFLAAVFIHRYLEFVSPLLRVRFLGPLFNFMVRFSERRQKRLFRFSCPLLRRDTVLLRFSKLNPNDSFQSANIAVGQLSRSTARQLLYNPHSPYLLELMCQIAYFLPRCNYLAYPRKRPLRISTIITTKKSSR